MLITCIYTEKIKQLVSGHRSYVTVTARMDIQDGRSFGRCNLLKRLTMNFLTNLKKFCRVRFFLENQIWFLKIFFLAVQNFLKLVI